MSLGTHIASAGSTRQGRSDRYKWIALTNTTIGLLMATIDSSIVLISLPAIFRGIGIDPLTASNTSYLLWMLMAYLVVTAVLVVSFGRIGDMFGRVKMYNLGFAVFTVGSLAASLTYFGGPAAALYLIGMRIVQGVGGAMIMANSTAILTDAFPEHERGMALGINSVAGIAGTFIGLVVGGLLASVDWHLIFYVSVPIGLFGTVWAYLKLQEVQKAEGGRIDLPGNILFGAGLVAVLVGITYSLQPYGGSAMGWLNPLVLGLVIGGVALLAAFVVVETKVSQPMFDMRLFRRRAFAAGNAASLLSSIARGGLMFILIIWLQGIWLPLHGYNFVDTPLWAGIYMVPLTAGFLVAGPVSGFLSDRFGARPFATGGMIAAAASFALLTLLPVNFRYIWFALLLLANGLGMGMFVSPNTAGIMNSVPDNRRGVASGMRSTFQNAGMTLSIGLFFTIMIIGLSGTLPAALSHGLASEGLSSGAAAKIARLPPASVLFAAFLGYNPMSALLGSALKTLSPAHRAVLTGHSFFADLISGPFHHGLTIVFAFGVVMCLIAAASSWLRGGKAAAGTGATLEAPSEPAGQPRRAPAPVPAPVRSGGPVRSEAAAGPGAAARPGARAGPGVSARPRAAAAPGMPAGPEVPARPGMTAGPGVPAQPGAPAGPGAAAQPGAPGRPGAPMRSGARAGGWDRQAEWVAGRRQARVVTISASFGAGGTEVGPAVARRLGLPFLDRAVPFRVAELLGVPAGAAFAHDQQVPGAVIRSLISLIGVPAEFGPCGAAARPADDEEAFCHATEQVLWELAGGPGAVVLGRAAAVVLASCPGALHVRLDGQAAARASRAAAREGIGQDAAWQRLNQTDRARAAYARQLYGTDPADPRLYHLVIDTTTVPLDACADAIAALATAPAGTSRVKPGGFGGRERPNRLG
jgi:MFS family permease/cytidylate kinase